MAGGPYGCCALSGVIPVMESAPVGLGLASLSPVPWMDIPYRQHGRDRSGCDCWGLIRLFYREALGLDVPSYCPATVDVTNVRAVSPVIKQSAANIIWRSIQVGHSGDDPKGLGQAFQRGDILCFGAKSLYYHVGLYWSDTLMLHTRSGTDSSTENWRSPLWLPRLQAVYRHHHL